MQRRTIILAAGGIMMTSKIYAAESAEPFESACDVLRDAIADGSVRAASVYVRQDGKERSDNFGMATNDRAVYLLGSISKPICIAALMTLFEEGLFELDDPLVKYLPEFHERNFPNVTIRHLLTHTSGLPDQLPNNAQLRAAHAPLSTFLTQCAQLSFSFAPGTSYEYSSMGILLACEIAQRITSQGISTLVQQRVFDRLAMKDSALGLGNLDRHNIMPCQVEFGAPEAGGGSEASQDWNWNSQYWRALGAPWGGCHASATDVGRFIWSFIEPTDGFLSPRTTKLMTTNHNASDMESRGLAFDVDLRTSYLPCSPNTFGHTGSTGTIAWADIDRRITCVVLTTLPGQAVPTKDHPRIKASEFFCDHNLVK